MRFNQIFPVGLPPKLEFGKLDEPISYMLIPEFYVSFRPGITNKDGTVKMYYLYISAGWLKYVISFNLDILPFWRN
jgi:hypothetical protein